MNLKRKRPKKCGNDDIGKKLKQSSDSDEDGGDEGYSSLSVKRVKDKKNPARMGKAKGKNQRKAIKKVWR